MRLEERKQGLAWEIRTSEKVRGMDLGRRRKEGLAGCRAVFRLSKAGGELWALQSGLTLHPRAAHLGDLQLSPPSLTPSQLNAAAGQSPYKSVEAGNSESSTPWSERVILPTPQEASSYPLRIVHAFSAG